MKNDWKRTIALFFVSQTLSLLGSSLVQYAVMWYITLETQSGAMMTLSIVCGFIPTFLLSPFAGVWADRFDRRKLIILSDGMIALVTLVMAVVFMNGFQSVWLLLVVSAVRAVGTAIQGPAVGAILPQIVPADKLMRMNGISGTIQSAIMLVSPALSGFLLTVASIEVIFLTDVVTAALAIGVILAFLRVPPHEKALAKQETGYLTDMKLGFRYIRDHRYLISFLSYIGFLLIMVTPAAFLTPLQTTRTFGEDVWRLTAIEMVFSIGMMLGGFLISAWGGFRNRMHTMIAANLIMAVCTIALGLVPDFAVYLVFMGIFGIAMPLFNAPSAVILQEHVEGNYLGRVFSVFTMLSTSLMPLAMLVFGPLGDAVRIEWLLIVTGAVMAVYGLTVLRAPRLMEAGIPKKE